MRAAAAVSVRAVLFDMDGVLVFSEDAWFAVYNETLAHFGHPAISREAFDAIYGNGTEADRDAYMPERTVAEVDAAYARFFEARLDRIRPNPEAAETLRELRRMGVASSVATNTNRPLAARILDVQGLLPLLDAVTGADEAGAGKARPGGRPPRRGEGGDTPRRLRFRRRLAVRRGGRPAGARPFPGLPVRGGGAGRVALSALVGVAARTRGSAGP